MRRSLFVSFLGVLLLASASAVAYTDDDQSLTPQSLIDRHLATIGTSDARAAHRACGVVGTAKFTIAIGGAGQADGSFKLASDDLKLRMVMKFNTPNYMGEDFTTDGSKVNVANLVGSKTTLLGPFFADRMPLLKERLFGGSLSGTWVFLDPKAPSKVKYNGLKTVEGRSLHELEFEPRKDVGDVRIRIYLEPGSFHHVMTTYDTKMVAQTSRFSTTNSRQMGSLASQESRISLREQFDDFKTVDGVTIPMRWTIDLTNDAKGASQLRWIISVEDVMHGEIDPASFKIR